MFLLLYYPKLQRSLLFCRSLKGRHAGAIGCMPVGAISNQELDHGQIIVLHRTAQSRRPIMTPAVEIDRPSCSAFDNGFHHFRIFVLAIISNIVEISIVLCSFDSAIDAIHLISELHLRLLIDRNMLILRAIDATEARHLCPPA
jgi:hypothetical protein